LVLVVFAMGSTSVELNPNTAEAVSKTSPPPSVTVQFTLTLLVLLSLEVAMEEWSCPSARTVRVPELVTLPNVTVTGL
jgi:hypothetical protein